MSFLSVSLSLVFVSFLCSRRTVGVGGILKETGERPSWTCALWPAGPQPPCRGGPPRAAQHPHSGLGSGPALPVGRSASELAKAAFAHVRPLHSEKESQKRLY